MTRPAFRKPAVVTERCGIVLTRQISEFGALYQARRGEAPALYSTNRRGEALAWLDGYARAMQDMNQPLTR